MDAVVSAALEEVCAQGAGGIPLLDLWPALSPALVSAGLSPSSDAVKRVLWARLLAVPSLRFLDRSGGAPLLPQDPALCSLEDAEKLGLTVLAEEHLRDNFVGLYDRNASGYEIPPIQRRVLERLAAARTNGITQRELAKEFGMKGNNIFYIVRNLEYQQLIVRQSIIIRAKELGMDGENELKNTSIVNTNLIHLHRFAKNTTLSSQQRIEITRPDLLESLGDADGSSLVGDGTPRECVKEDVCIKDFLPAMRAVCDKLEEADGKVLVVSNIKVALGYRKTPGHRAWRNIVNRLKDSSLVEEFQAEINKKAVKCLRLLKKFDDKDFQPKTTRCGYDGFDSEHVVKYGKRGQINDQLLELPIDQCIYDMIDAEGSRGITISEVCKRLGLSAKRIYTRIIGMCSRFGMYVQAEINDKTPLYRVWTSRNYQHYSTNLSPDSSSIPIINEVSVKSSDLVPSDQSCKHQMLLPTDDISHLNETYNGQIVFETPSTCSRLNDDGDAQTVLYDTPPQNLIGEFTKVGDTELGIATNVGDLSALSSKDALSISSTSSKNGSLRIYQRTPSTVDGERREQRILERLKNEKFVLASELHRWLEGLEKDKPTMMARKTLNRTLNRLQKEGLCKCIQVSIPVVTDITRTRATEVILHPSIETFSSELSDQIYRRQRQFDIQSRGGSTRSKSIQPMTVVTGLNQSSNRVIDKPMLLEAMRSNGFVPAKMVRAKLLHNFLWDHLSSLPDWHMALNSKEHSYDVKHSRSTRHLFALDAAIKAMPFELFLQVVGSSKAIDGMAEHCRIGSRLMDLPTQEYKSLMDTYANGRLSSIIDILLRLKLIQLVSEGLPIDANVLPHAVLTRALELRPYIEEPLPRASPSSIVNALNLHPRIRHDFVLSKKETVDAYWETLEYCYAAADPAVASHAFPGSAVPEVFHSRSWTSVRVMTVEQRKELLKLVGDDRPKKKLLFEECVNIAKELSLTVEQVLRVHYDTRRSRIRNYYRSSDCKERDNLKVAKKRRRDSLKHIQDDNETRESSGPIISTSDADTEQIEKISTSLCSTKKYDSHLHPSNDDNCVNTEGDSGPPDQHGENCNFISQSAFPRPKLMRRKRFPWTDSSDRQLVLQYARYRAAMGARFFRVDWASVSDLPAYSNICQRRMALLNSNGNIRKAVMRLCNLLGERYSRYLAETCGKQEKGFPYCDDSRHRLQDVRPKGTFVRNLPATQEITSTSNSQFCWDDFEDPEIKVAVNEVLRYKRLAKLQYPKRVGSRDEKEWPNISPKNGTNSDAEECVTPKGQNDVPTGTYDGTTSHVERRGEGTTIRSADVRSKSTSHQPHRKYLKLLNRRGNSIRRPVSKSLAVANAIELLKLVFLSTSSSLEVQAKLRTLLQLYSEDLFEAVNYLKEKDFMVMGHGNRRYVLSQKFWRNASSSLFPIDSGKRAANFLSWLHKQENELMSDGVSLTSDLQCGEVFQLFALVSMEELCISPRLPNEGIGEADEPNNSKSFLPIDYIGEVDVPRSLKRKCEIGKMSSGEKDKKQKPQAKIDPNFCSRREKGFPGIKVLLNRATVHRDNDVQCTTPKGNDNFYLSYENKAQVNSYSSVETICFPPLSSNLNKCSFYGNSQTRVSQESPCEAMITYAALLSSRSTGTNEVVNFSLEVFKSVYSKIHQAGEQGLSMEEISEVIGIQGVQKAKIVVDTLEVFQLATKVNAYDTIRIVDSSYRSKYFINTVGHRNQDHELTIYMKPQASSYEVYQKLLLEKCDTIQRPENITSMNLSDGHKVTILDLPKEPVLTQVEKQPAEGASTSEECVQLKDVPIQGNEVVNDKYPASDVQMFWPILPWINGDGSTNTVVYKGLTRRVLGIVMQNPGIVEEEIICRMDVLNPQTCRELLETMILGNHITVRVMNQTTTIAPPAILQSLVRCNFKKSDSRFRKHYFANPTSTGIL